VEVHFYQPDNLSVSCSALARHQKAQKGFKINVMALEVLDFTRFIQSNTIKANPDGLALIVSISVNRYGGGEPCLIISLSIELKELYKR